jgi:hypothetical protein
MMTMTAAIRFVRTHIEGAEHSEYMTVVRHSGRLCLEITISEDDMAARAKGWDDTKGMRGVCGGVVSGLWAMPEIGDTDSTLPSEALLENDGYANSFEGPSRAAPWVAASPDEVSPGLVDAIEAVWSDSDWACRRIVPFSAVRSDGSLPAEILTLARLADGELVVEVCRLIHEHDIGTPNDPGWVSDEGATPVEPRGLSGYPIYRLTSLDGDEELLPEGHTWTATTLDEAQVPGLLARWGGDGEIVFRLGGRALVSLGEDTILGIGDDDAGALEDARASSQAGVPVEGESRAYYVRVTAKARAAYDAGREDEIMFDIEHGFVLHKSEKAS